MAEGSSAGNRCQCPREAEPGPSIWACFYMWLVSPTFSFLGLKNRIEPKEEKRMSLKRLKAQFSCMLCSAPERWLYSSVASAGSYVDRGLQVWTDRAVGGLSSPSAKWQCQSSDAGALGLRVAYSKARGFGYPIVV